MTESMNIKYPELFLLCKHSRDLRPIEPELVTSNASASSFDHTPNYG